MASCPRFLLSGVLWYDLQTFGHAAVRLVYGHGDLGNDLTRQHESEPLGERIIVSGRLLEEDGPPVCRAFVEVWLPNAAGRYRHDRDR